MQANVYQKIGILFCLEPEKCLSEAYMMLTFKTCPLI